ncbi:SIR2 family protein [Paenibacillus sp. URB8-2]|uniref:SIR2 family protein n=1 Tax=Paenibacillus sp. URB8-2 TaxID=2741301 RepID=UPI0015B92AC1|nr:SIR2 family protein [Paenibacillus sp. URB8-2]BCG57176.1 hypothetical protein PUR_06010 [Paenibacillus sp. URB8-2]
MIEWPQQIITDIARRKVVLFLGAGISRNSVGRDGHTRPPTWEEFLKNAATKIRTDTTYINQLINEKDFLTACEIIFEKMGDHNFYSFAEESFLQPGFTKHKIHEHIFGLDSRIVVTPNVDKIYDIFASQESMGTVLTKKYHDNDLADKIRSQHRIVVKAHGSIEQPNMMIFTRKQYTKARYEHAAFYEILNALALTHTFIFLGAGLSDPDIRLILENYTHTFPNCRPHYMVTSAENVNEDLKKSTRDNTNIELVTYSSENNHIELVNSLSHLVGLVEEERTKLLTDMNW